HGHRNVDEDPTVEWTPKPGLFTSDSRFCAKFLNLFDGAIEDGVDPAPKRVEDHGSFRLAGERRTTRERSSKERYDRGPIDVGVSPRPVAPANDEDLAPSARTGGGAKAGGLFESAKLVFGVGPLTARPRHDLVHLSPLFGEDGIEIKSWRLV